MSRTKGSGWGAGPILYQTCPQCLKRKAFYDPIPGEYTGHKFRCTYCKERFSSDILIRMTYRSQFDNWVEKRRNERSE